MAFDWANDSGPYGMLYPEDDDLSYRSRSRREFGEWRMEADAPHRHYGGLPGYQERNAYGGHPTYGGDFGTLMRGPHGGLDYNIGDVGGATDDRNFPSNFLDERDPVVEPRRYRRIQERKRARMMADAEWTPMPQERPLFGRGWDPEQTPMP